jgi:2-iminobutanoate/2-iminopropanoate deaminase
MNKRAITSDPSLPFSEVVISNGLAFVSGQVSIDDNAKLIDGGIEEQTKVTFDNLKNALQKAGLGLEHIVRTNCYLTNREDLAGFNKPMLASSHQINLPAQLFSFLLCQSRGR